MSLPPPTPPSSHSSAAAAAAGAAAGGDGVEAAPCKYTTKNGRRPIACKICKRPSFYSYYTVRCCEGCKQFFRRIVVNKREYHCRRDGRCSMRNDDLSTGERCLGCRLDKCLLVGMQPRMVNAVPGDEEWREFVERLEERRKDIQKKQAAASSKAHTRKMDADEAIDVEDEYGEHERKSAEDDEDDDDQQATAAVRLPVLSNVKDWQQMNVLLLMEGRQRAIWNALTDVPPWLAQFPTIKELLQFPGYILNVPKMRKRKNMATAQKCPTDANVINFICIDSLLMLEWERALAGFTELETNDQLVLLKNIHVPFMALCSAFYGNATLPSAGTWTRGIGCYLFHDEMSSLTDERLKFLYEKVFCKTVMAVNALGICQEEFVLLLSILCCNSTGAELSASARDRLYDQSTMYCGILMRLLQFRLGPEAGARKYADCMHLLELLFSLKCTFQLFNAYWSMSNVQMKTTPKLEGDSPWPLRPDVPPSLAPFCAFL